MSTSKVWGVATALAMLWLPCSAAATNVAVVRIGDGGSALSSGATATFVEIRDGTTGSLVTTYPLPIAQAGANAPLTLAGSATTEGAVTRSSDARFLVLAGYGAPPGVATISTTPAASVNRVIARIDAGGTIDTTTRLGSTAFDGAAVRSAASVAGATFWAAGNGAAAASAGAFSAQLGATSATQLASANLRRVAIFDDQLYFTAAAASFHGLGTVGTGLPTTGGQTLTLLPGFPTSTADPLDAVLLERNPAVSGPDTAYVADDRAVASGGGVQKWTLDAGTWTLATTFTTGLTAGALGLAATTEGNAVRLWATTAEAPSRLVTLLDDGSAGPAFTPLTVAAANTVFRGIALAPIVPQPGVLALAAATSSVAESAAVAGVTVNRTGGNNVPVSVHYATADGSASAGSDYTASEGTLTLAAGADHATFEIPITADTADETDETFTVALSQPAGGATLGTPATQEVTILDDDAPPVTTTSPPASTPPPGPAPTPTPVALTTAPTPRPSVQSGGRVRVKGNVITSGLTASCPAGAGVCRFSAVARSGAAVLARGSLTVPAGKRSAVKLTLNAAGRKALKRKRRLKLKVTVRLPDATSKIFSVTVRAPRR